VGAIIERDDCGGASTASNVFVSELQQKKAVSDATFARAEARLGKPGVVDLTAICGDYTLLAMELNAAGRPLPKDGTPLPRHDLSIWTVTDNWPERVPVTAAEANAFEVWSANILNELFSTGG